MLNLFELPANDQSIYYLGQLFGNVGTVLVPANGGSALLGAMFKTLNTTALVLAAILITHTVVIGLLKTAQEGKFLGKQWDSFWVPIRLLLGIAALFPTGAGYSILQVLMMWVIVQGVGAADKLWITVINFVTIAGSPYAGVSSTSGVTDQTTFSTLFQALTCEATALGRPLNSAAGNGGNASLTPYADAYTSSNNTDGPTYYYYCSDPTNASSAFCSTSNNSPQLKLPTNLSGVSAVQYGPNVPIQGSSCKALNTAGVQQISCPIGPGGACGTLTYSNYYPVCQNIAPGNLTQQIQCASFTAQSKALQGVVSQFETIAAQFVGVDHDYLAFTENANPISPPVYMPNPWTPGNLTPNWQVPTWITTYCESLNQNAVNPTPCCVYGQTNPPSNLLCASYGTINFPYPFYPQDPFRQNTTNTAVKNLLWPMAMMQLISGSSSTQSITSGNATPVNFLQVATNYYEGQLNQGMQSAIVNAASGGPAVPASSWQAAAEGSGWIMAGAYYYSIAQMNGNNLKASTPTLSIVAPDPSMPNTTNVLSNYRNNFKAAAMLLGAMSSAGSGNGVYASFGDTPGFQQMGDTLNGFAAKIMDDFMGDISGGSAQVTNPLAAMQQMGEKFLITAQVVYPVFMGISIAILVGTDIDVLILGSGLTQNPLSTAATFLIYTTWGLLMMFVGLLFAYGGTLAVYLPMIPYIVFTFGAIGWFIATIEAMVAAPFVALGIMSPAGEHEIWGRSSPAIMILMNIFLRPSLMIMGMMAAMLMAPVAVTMINAGFKAVMSSILPNPGIAELIFFISSYTMLVITVLNKCFALIHVIPTRVLTFIGGQAISYGEEEGLQAVKGGVDSTISGVSQGAKGSMAEMQKQHEKKSEAKRKQGPGVK